MNIRETRDSYGHGDGYVLLTPLFGGVVVGGSELPTVYASCAMSAHGFSGATEPNEPMVRIEAAELQRFIDDLRILERDRRGSASLTSHELRLSFHIINRVGSVWLRAELMNDVGYGEHHVSLGFQVDPTELLAILSDFEEMLTFPPPSSLAVSGP